MRVSLECGVLRYVFLRWYVVVPHRYCMNYVVILVLVVIIDVLL